MPLNAFPAGDVAMFAATHRTRCALSVGSGTSRAASRTNSLSDGVADAVKLGPATPTSVLMYATAFACSSARFASTHSVEPIRPGSSPSHSHITIVRRGFQPVRDQFAERARGFQHRRGAAAGIHRAINPRIVMIAEHDPFAVVRAVQLRDHVVDAGAADNPSPASCALPRAPGPT